MAVIPGERQETVGHFVEAMLAQEPSQIYDSITGGCTCFQQEPTHRRVV
jgi:hypothetical protein